MERVSGKPNFLKVICACSMGESHYIVMELFRGTSIDVLLKDYYLSFKSFHFIAYELATAVSELASMNIIHGDIKPMNIMVNVLSNEVKLIDFGMASDGPCSTAFHGTFSYIAPEIVRRAKDPSAPPYSFEVDVFSLGATCMYLYMETTPYLYLKSKGKMRGECLQDLLDGNLQFPEIDELERYRNSEIKKEVLDEFTITTDFIHHLVHPNIEIRAKSKTLTQHPFFQQSLLKEVMETFLALFLERKNYEDIVDLKA